MRLLLIAVLWCAAGMASAGAWMRAPGTGFLAFSTTHDDTGRTDGALYAEYGLRPKLTLGIKIDADMTRSIGEDGTAYVFARRPIPTGERAFKLAYDVGLGHTFGDTSGTVLRTGFSYGRGFKLSDRDGWIAVDAAVVWAEPGTDDTVKLDGTVGLALSDRFKVMLQVFGNRTGADSSVTLAPSLIWQRKEKAPSVVLGAETREGTLALKIGVWRSF